MRRSLVTVLVLIAFAGSAAAQPATPIVDDRPAEPGAIEAGAAQVAEGTKLGEENKYELALGRFLAAASEHPSAAHDCLVALSYLRIGRLTLARLWRDAAWRRGDEVPTWCKGQVSDQLAEQLAVRGFVEVEVEITPAEAEVWIGEEAYFRGGRAVWLPPGEVEVRAELAGHTAVRRTETVADGARIAIELVVEVPVEEQRRGVLPLPGRGSEVRPPPKLAWVGLTVGAAALLTGGIFHGLAASTRADANAEPRTSARFDELDQRFVRQRAVAVSGYAVGAVAVGLGAWLLLRDDRGGGEPTLGVILAPDQVGLSVSGQWSLGR